MLKYIIFIKNLIYYLIVNNPNKSIIIFISIILLSISGRFNDQERKYNVVAYFNIGGDHVYIHKKQENYLILKTDKVEKVTNGVLKRMEYSDLNWFGFILSFIFILLSIVGSFTDDWDLLVCRGQAFSKFIYCEEEDGKYYYFALDRLISVKNNLIDQKYTIIANDIGINSFSKLKRCPIYSTKKQKREKILNKILN